MTGQVRELRIALAACIARLSLSDLAMDRRLVEKASRALALTSPPASVEPEASA